MPKKATRDNVYKIWTAKSSVLITADSPHQAKTIFQERFGYWPDDDQMSASKEEEQLARIKEG